MCHVSPTHDEELVTLIHLDVHVFDPHLTSEHDDVAPTTFSKGPEDTSHLPLYTYYDAVHVLDGEVA